MTRGRTQICAGLIALALPMSIVDIARAAWPSDPSVNLPVCTAVGPQGDQDLVGDLSGGVIVVWSDGRNSDGVDVYSQHILASGRVDPTWPLDGRALCLAPGNHSRPAIVADGVGGAIVVWNDDRGGTGDAIYGMHLQGNGIPDPAWPADGIALTTSTANPPWRPTIVADGAGGAIVTWQDRRDVTFQDGYYRGFRVYAQHVLATGVLDSRWPKDGFQICPTSSINQFAPASAPDGSGGVIIAWSDVRNPDDPYESHIYGQHVLVNGVIAPGWPDSGLAISGGPGYFQVGVSMVADGVGGVIVSWEDSRNDIGDIYAQHVLAGGATDPSWPVDGLGVCIARDVQESPRIISDKAGGAIMCWVDTRRSTLNTFEEDIFAEHVLGTGVVDPAWPLKGLPVCTAAGYQDLQAIASDEAGGAIITWQDGRQGQGIYAQHVFAAGMTDSAWAVNGVVISNAGIDAHPVIVADGTGGAVIAWTDGRAPAGDIYAQRVQANGVLGGDVVLPCLRVGFDLMPHFLNDRSHGRWAAGRIRIPDPYRASQIDVDAIRVNGVVPVFLVSIADCDHTMIVKCSRNLLRSTLVPGERVPVTITGTITGMCFSGTDTVEVKIPRIHKPDGDTRLVAGRMTEVAWDADPGVSTVSLLSSPDGGATWRVEIATLPNVGNCQWTVPEDALGTILLSVQPLDPYGVNDTADDSENAVSDPLVVAAPLGVANVTTEFSVRPARNPTSGPLSVTLSLPGSEHAMLDVFDIDGRALESREVGSLGPGRHTLQLGQLATGMYLVRLSQAGRSRTSRMIVLR